MIQMGLALLQSLRVSPGGVNMGIVTFSDDAVRCNEMTGDSEQLQDTLWTLNHIGGESCVGCGLREAARMLRQRSAARLAMQPQAVVITVTDGGNNWPRSNYKEYFDESLRMLRESAPGVLSALVDTGRETLERPQEKREAERVVRLLPTSDSLRFPAHNKSSLDRALGNLISVIYPN
eukprot:m51a1_g12656 hypothetical protein (178) ;mRNA; f:43-647